MKKTFAQVADMLGKKQAKYEERLDNSSDKIARDSAKLMLTRIDGYKNRLFESQESMKVQAPQGDVPQHSFGALLKKAGTWLGDSNNTDKISNVANTALPFVDNMFAAKSLNNMKAPTAPILQKTAQINTNYNINPQLKENRDANTVLNNTIDATNTSGGSAMNQRLAGFVKRMTNSGQLHAQKNQVEGQLEDKQRIINTQTENANIGTMNQFNEATREFENNIETEKVANVSNAVGDASQMFKDNKMFEMDKQRMELYGSMSPNALAQWDTEFGKASLKEKGFEEASAQFNHITGTENIETLNRLFMEAFGQPFR